MGNIKETMHNTVTFFNRFERESWAIFIMMCILSLGFIIYLYATASESVRLQTIVICSVNGFTLGGLTTHLIYSIKAL
jgi:hypothetical protein